MVKCTCRAFTKHHRESLQHRIPNFCHVRSFFFAFQAGTCYSLLATSTMISLTAADTGCAQFGSVCVKNSSFEPMRVALHVLQPVLVNGSLAPGGPGARKKCATALPRDFGNLPWAFVVSAEHAPHRELRSLVSSDHWRSNERFKHDTAHGTPAPSI